MRGVIQRVKKAKVYVQGKAISGIGKGLLVFVGITDNDGEEDVRLFCDKVCNLRIFEDSNGKMNHSVKEINGEILLVSQFTLYGDCRKGRRPNFMRAAPADKAEKIYYQLVESLQSHGVPVHTGQYQAEMEVCLINDGPVTILIDTHKNF
ncbi:MAG: D-aminoacyl-tRNA deacylase [Clostridia bacterium]